MKVFSFYLYTLFTGNHLHHLFYCSSFLIFSSSLILSSLNLARCAFASRAFLFSSHTDALDCISRALARKSRACGCVSLFRCNSCAYLFGFHPSPDGTCPDPPELAYPLASG